MSQIVSAILAQTQPRAMWPQSDILWPGNWPVDAVLGIVYTTNHRSFGNQECTAKPVYFNSIDEYRQWLADEQAHICDIDYAYSLHGELYEWDWGPVLKDRIHLG